MSHTSAQANLDAHRWILCYYVNHSSQLRIARICNIVNWYYEKVMFPGDRLLFEAPVHSLLEIYSSFQSTPVLIDRICCDRLSVSETDPAVADLRSQLPTIALQSLKANLPHPATDPDNRLPPTL